MEAQSVSDLLVEAIDWMMASPPHRSLWKREDVAADVIAKELKHYYLGQINGLPVVTFMLTETDRLYWPDASDSALYIHRIAVARQAAAQVTGKSILPDVFQFAARLARERGKTKLRLDCDKTRPSLAQLYEGQGFVHHSDIQLSDYLGARYQKAL